MSKYEKAELTNMCMIYDGAGRVVVQDKVGKNWGGITFPGGHVEKDESFVDSVIREVKEETGLDIQSPKLCGIMRDQMVGSRSRPALHYPAVQNRPLHRHAA